MTSRSPFSLCVRDPGFLFFFLFFFWQRQLVDPAREPRISRTIKVNQTIVTLSEKVGLKKTYFLEELLILE